MTRPDGPLPLPAARRFTGVFGVLARRCGLRFDGPLDNFGEALRAIGVSMTYEPLENGIPTGRALVGFRTWGSPWTDVLEATPAVVLTSDLARAVSSAGHSKVLLYDYDLEHRRFRHSLFAAGRRDEDWCDDSATGEGERYLEDFHRALKMRDWGIVMEDLAALRLPFAPALLMEAYFLRLDSGLSKVWGV